MKQPRESYLLKSFLDNYEKQAAVNTLLKRNNYSIKKINAFFKAVQLPTIDKFISDQNDRVVTAMYALLTRAKANENYAIKISVMGFIRYELPYLFNPKDSMKIRRLQDFFYNFLDGCSPEVRALFVKERRSWIDVMNEVLDKMNLSRIERSDPQQFVQAILLNVNYGTSTGKFSFYDFLVYGLFLQKKEANVESTSSEIKEAQKKGTNTTNVLKRHLINTPAYDLLFLNFSDNVIEYKKLFENKQRRDEALTTKRVHLSSDACLILNVSKDNPVIGHLPLFKEDSLGREPELSGNRHRSNVTSINFWKPPVLLPLSSIDGFEAANFHCSTYRRFEEASFLNNLNVEDFLRVAESPPSFFVQSELQNSCTNIPSTGERKEEILTTAFDQDVSEWITRNVAEIDYQNLMLPL